MSRNLGITHCDQCGSTDVVATGERLNGFEYLPKWYLERAANQGYNYLTAIFSDAVCNKCQTTYTAWYTDGHGKTGMDIADLSYRSTFDDEPGLDRKDINEEALKEALKASDKTELEQAKLLLGYNKVDLERSLEERHYDFILSDLWSMNERLVEVNELLIKAIEAKNSV